MKCTKIGNSCTQHWSTGWARFFFMTVYVTQSVFQKLNELGYEALPHQSYSTPDLLPKDCQFFKHLDNFLQGKCFHNQQEAENTSQEFSESQSMDFYATGINKLISHWQKCVDCNGSCFINKNVFEPSYNDLKFTVWNCSYFFTRLIFAMKWWDQKPWS